MGEQRRGKMAAEVIQTAITLVLMVCLAGLATAADWKTKLLLGIPSAWLFWMVLPELLWLLAVWRALVDRLRDSTADLPYARKRRLLRQFASTSSIIVDVLFVMSFLLVVSAGILKSNSALQTRTDDVPVVVSATLAVAGTFDLVVRRLAVIEIGRHGKQRAKPAADAADSACHV